MKATISFVKFQLEGHKQKHKEAYNAHYKLKLCTGGGIGRRASLRG